MLVATARVSVGWHPALPHVSGATRKSPGFTNFMNSADSLSHSVYARSGMVDRFRNAAFLGCTCAFSFVASYCADFGTTPTVIATLAFPPWQSAHPKRTPREGCIVGSSVAV